MTSTKRAALKAADHADPIAVVLLAMYAVAQHFHPDLEISSDTMLSVAAALAVLRGYWERRKRIRWGSPAEWAAMVDAVADAVDKSRESDDNEEG